MRIGIDATNIGGGGGVTHLQEVLNSLNSNQSLDIPNKIIVFSSTKVLKKITDSELIEKLSFPGLNRNLFHRIYFQFFLFDKEIKSRCDILFSITGDYIGNFKPVVGMSQNMLLFERDIWKEIKQPKEIIRFWLNFQKQKFSFKNSDGIIFISNYAKEYISTKLDLKGKEITVIHHGISPRFKNEIQKQKPLSEYSFSNPFKLVYVSTVHVYKHQWNVVEAIGILRAKGFPIILNLVGGVIFEPAGKKLNKTIRKIDPKNEFIYYHGHLPYNKIDIIYKDSDGIIFASTCENMPNILIESMASGKPIACSDKQPMPEFLKENGFFFDAHDVNSIIKSIEGMLMDYNKREEYSKNNLLEVSKYNWKTTSIDTFKFIDKIFNSKCNVQK